MGQHETDRRGRSERLEGSSSPLEPEAVRRVKRKPTPDARNVESGSLEFGDPATSAEALELREVIPANAMNGRPERASPPARRRPLDGAPLSVVRVSPPALFAGWRGVIFDQVDHLAREEEAEIEDFPQSSRNQMDHHAVGSKRSAHLAERAL